MSWDESEQHHWRRDIRCPYGQPGDRLIIKETFALPKSYDRFKPSEGDKRWPIYYLADKSHGELVAWTDEEQEIGKIRPSIFMPSWASRITLEVVSVRVERLQEISEADAVAEGVKDYSGDHSGESQWPTECYRSLWESINGTGSWSANPWVWVVEFKRL